MSHSFDDYHSCLEQSFLLQQDDYRDTLQLVEVNRLSKAQSIGDREPFSIVFQSVNKEPIPQQIYRLSNEQLGDLEIFIVPIGQDEAGVRYEAVFS